jgi:3',5'-nucleoside bisphosphate phosphatase
MTGGIDLHLHSDRSDGGLPGCELLDLCAGRSVRLVAITDHDIVADPLTKPPSDLTVITGIEVTAQWRGREVHCLGYLYRAGEEQLRRSVAGYRYAVLAGWREIIDRAAQFGCLLGWPDVEAAFGADRVPYAGRMLDLLLAGTADGTPLAGARGLSHKQRVADWFAPGRPLSIELPIPPELTQVTGWLRQSGGVAVLAHPLAQWTLDQLEGDLPALRAAGVAGLETWSSWHRLPGADQALVELASRYAMVATAGSDFHGVAVKSWVPHPGAAGSGLPHPDDLLQDLLTARERG